MECQTSQQAWGAAALRERDRPVESVGGLANQGVEEENQITPVMMIARPHPSWCFKMYIVTLVELIFRVDFEQTAVTMML